MGRDERIEIIKKIEEKRGSKVICYVTSDRGNLSASIAGDVVPLMHEHILALEEEERQKLDLFIYSRGGHNDVPWTIVSMFREYCSEGSFSVLIPYRAHSAATVISLGADEIIMTKKSELGPIDITMGSGPYNPTEKNSNQRLPISVEDVTGYFSLLNRVGCERPDEVMNGFNLLAKEVHPLALGAVSRLLEETKLVALRLLSTRAEPFDEEENHEIVKKISSEIYSHSHTISRTEAERYIGLKQVKNAEKDQIDKELWDLYNEYKELFHLEEPFLPEEELISNEEDEKTWGNLEMACVESYNKLHVFKQDLNVKKIKDIPNTINLTVEGVNLPPLNIPNLPQNISSDDLQQLIAQIVNQVLQQHLDQAARSALDELMKYLPHKGFQHVALNYGWVEEV